MSLAPELFVLTNLPTTYIYLAILLVILLNQVGEQLLDEWVSIIMFILTFINRVTRAVKMLKYNLNNFFLCWFLTKILLGSETN